MRRFLLTSGITLSLFTIFVSFQTPVVHAQSGVLANPPDTSFVAAPNTSPLAPSGPTVIDSIIAAQAGPQADPAAAKTPLDFGVAGLNTVLGGVMNWIMSIFAWLLGIAMVTLDYTVLYTVVKMGDYVHKLKAIGIAWRILRDVGNITLIFGFLAIGITTILNVDWYGGGKKMLPMMLVAAVFLNFSLFMSEAVIDSGNLFATQFYTQINGGVPAGQKLNTSGTGVVGTVTTAASSVSDEVLSNKIMSQLGLQSLYAAANSGKPVFQAGNITFIGMMGILLFLVAAFVMFSLAFVLIARFIALIFIIILSPLGFAGLAIPQLAGVAREWWDTLFKQTITAPILLLLLYIALTIITDAQFLGFGPKPDYLGFIQNSTYGFNLPELASALLSFLVAMGLLLSVTYFSKKLGTFGGDWAMKSAGKLSFGLTAAGMRSTGGWGLTAASRRFSSSRLARVPVIGRSVGGALSYGAKANFDVRGTSALKNFPGGGIDAGSPQKGGYVASEKARIKGREDYAKTLEQSVGEKNEQKAADEKLKEAKNAFKTSGTKENKKTLEEAQKGVDRLNPKMEYAKGLEWGPGKLVYANKAAADKIRGALKNKNKSDEAYNDLKKTIIEENNNEKKSEPGKEEKKPEGA